MKRIYMFLIMILSIAQLEGFIFEVHSIRKKKASNAGPDWVIGLGDLHDKKHPIGQSQKNDIMRFLSSFPKGTVKVLTEDLSSPGSFGRSGCGRFYINSRGGILGGMTNDCTKAGFDAENHEYRYCRVSSFGPILNNLKADVSRLASPNAITIAALYDEIKKEIDHIKSYDDGPIPKKIYDQHIDHIQKMLAKLNIVDDKNVSVAEYVKKHIPAEKLLDCTKALLTFDSELLDCKLAHAIKQECNKKYIVVIAGGAHVKRVCDLLLQDGYESFHTQLAQDERTSDINKCAGRTCDKSGYCVAPRAIDLSCLPHCCEL